MRREGSRGLSRRSLFPIHPEGFFPSLAPSSYPVLLSAQPYLFISFFLLGYFLISLVHRSWKRINRNFSKDLSIERSRSLSSSISISKYGRTLEACPRRRCPLGERKGAAILFLSSIVPIISLIPFCLFGAPGWFVSSSYLRNSLSSFVIILGERIGINFVEGRLWKGDSPFSIEVGKGVIDLFWKRPYWPSGGISFIADEKKSLWAELQKEVQAQEILSIGIGQASCLFIWSYPVVRRDVKSTKYMCVHSVPGTFLLAEYGCWS